MPSVGGYNFTTNSISWLFWSTKLNATNLNSLPINLRLYSEVKFALGDTEGMKLFDIYRIHEGMPIESVLAASWDTATGLVWHLDEDTYRRRINFRDIVLQGGLAVMDYNLSDPNLFETLRNHNQDKSKETVAHFARSCFFFLQPRFLERSTLLVYPFRGIVWLTSFLVMLMSLVFVSVVAVFDKSMRMSIGSALLYFSAIFSQQGTVLTSQWVSGRLVLLISLIFGYILLNYYSGQIVSEVLSRSPSTINTFSQLLSSPLLLAADKVPPYLKVRYKTQRSHHIPEIGVKVEKTGGYLNVEEGMEVVRGSLYAFETEASRGYYLIDKTYTQAEICSVGEISMPTVESFIALKYQSPFKQPISTTVMVLNERGLLKRLNNLWRYPKPQCSGTTNLVPVDLENASIAFYILLSGAVIGCATFLVENYVFKFGRSRNLAKNSSFLSLIKY
nr:PREDICTED: glutamate receptor 1-like [Bemisia tabaci]